MVYEYELNSLILEYESQKFESQLYPLVADVVKVN